MADSKKVHTSFLVQFTARVGGAAHQAKIAQTDILGFAAAMDENMLREETSATAYQKILMKMYTDTDKFANAAGIELSTFSKLLKEDANEALLQFAEGLSKKGGLADLAPIFGDLQTEGAGVSTVLSVMAGKADEIREHQKLANEAYREGTSILAEFEVQNGTVQAGLDKAKKNFAEIGITLGEQLLPIMANGIHLTSTGLKLLPAKMSLQLIDYRYETERGFATVANAFYVPMLTTSQAIDKKPDSFNVNNAINHRAEAESEPSPPERLEVALYEGALFKIPAYYTDPNGVSIDLTIPFAFGIPYARGYTHGTLNAKFNHFHNDNNSEDSFSLKEGAPMYNVLSLGNGIDTRVKRGFQFLDNIEPNPRPVFVIRGRKYACEKIEYNIEDEGVSPIKRGYFYEIND